MSFYESHSNRRSRLSVSERTRPSNPHRTFSERLMSLSASAPKALKLSRAPGLQARRGAQDFRRWLRKAYSPNECLWYGNVCLFFADRKSETELPALAAQPRAFSSLLSLPSQAQSVIKAFRRLGIGSADVFNTARQAAPSEKIITETRIETVFQTDTVFLDVPKIVEKSA